MYPITNQHKCTNCRSGGTSKCSNKKVSEQSAKDYPKVSNCDLWVFAPFHEYASGELYAKMHTES